MHDADLIIIGAGPAGMAAAKEAAGRGLSVVLLDEQPLAGGQIYRHVEQAASARGRILGPDFTKGLHLTAGLDHPMIRHITDAVVWKIDNLTRAVFTLNGSAATVEGRRLLIATGALERPMPVPGWTLPGVLTAGAAQILLKQSGMIVEGAVLVGAGPLLYLVAAQMCRAGTPPLAMVETQTKSDLLAALGYFGGALQGWHYLAKGLHLIAELRKHKVKRYTGANGIAIEGNDRASAVCFTVGQRAIRIPCSSVLLHHGVVPNVQIARAIGVPHDWNGMQRAFVPRRDDWGRTPLEPIFIGGDGAGIGGAEAAVLSGRLSALAIACDLDKLTVEQRDAAAFPLRRMLDREMAARPFIERAYPPYAAALSPEDSTIVCRCEEVTAGEVRRYAALGCLGPNQTKAYGRVGMGPCQGRFCGLTVTELLSASTGRSHDVIGYYKLRSPYKPVTLGEIAALHTLSPDKQHKETAE